MTDYDGGELLIDAFNDLGVEYVFCASGSEWAPAWEALARRQSDGSPAPAYLDLWHETVAVGMATGFGLVTRRPQAVLLHATPGLLQGSMAVHGALLAGVGMVVTSSESTTYGDGPGQDPGGQWYRNLSIVGGPHGVAAPWTKWSQQIGSVATLYEGVKRAGELAARAPSGPVYLNVPLELLLEQAEPPRSPKAVVPKGRRQSAPEDVDAVARLLAAAEFPVIITETTGREPGGFEALVALAESIGVGVVEPSSAVSANFPKSSPLSLGGDPGPLLAQADLVLLVNCRAPYYPPSAVPGLTTVVIDEVPQRPHVVYQVLHADHYLEGGAAETLDQLREAALALTTPEQIGRRTTALTAAGAAWHRQTAELEARAAAAAGARIDPVALAVRLRELVEHEEAVVVDETITHGRLVQRHIGWERPDSFYYVQGGLGQGIAVALGVKLADRDRLVVFTVGDGAYLYNPLHQSFQAAKDHGLPVLIVVFNNRQYLSMKLNHLRFYPQGHAVQTENHLGVDLATQPDLAALAAPFGFHTETVEDPAALDAALERALASVKAGTTAVLNVQVAK